MLSKTIKSMLEHREHRVRSQHGDDAFGVFCYTVSMPGCPVLRVNIQYHALFTQWLDNRTCKIVRVGSSFASDSNAPQKDGVHR